MAQSNDYLETLAYFGGKACLKEKFPMIYEAIRKGHERNANAASVPAENNDIIGRKDILTVNLAMPPHDNAANDGQPLTELHSHYNYTEKNPP